METSSIFAHRIAAVALDEFESQGVFMVLLESLARPGTRHRLPEALPTRAPAALVLASALADVDVTVAVLDDSGTEHEPDEGWAAALMAATGCRGAPFEDAAMVVALGPVPATTVARLRRGDALHPELGTRLILTGTDILDADPDRAEIVLDLGGPGVAGTRRVGIDGVDADVLEALLAANADFPAGVDAWIVTPTGDVVGIPRSTRGTVTSPGATPDREGA